MEEQLIGFETAKLANEQGFDFHCNGFRYHIVTKKLTYFGNDDGAGGEYMNSREFIVAPTQSLIQKWLREVHKLEVLVYCNAFGWMWELNKAFSKDSFSGCTFIKWSENSGPNDSAQWDTYEEALEEGLKEALNII
jgi:hypothetical protein